MAENDSEETQSTNGDSTFARPVLLGVVGDSAAGKTTLTKGLVRALGEDTVAHVGTDDYHKYDREQRKEIGITPLNPECNYIDIMAQHINLLRAGEPILKPIYQHSDGSFGAPEYVEPSRFVLIEGLLGYYTPELRSAYDVRAYLAPPEDLRRKWKIERDTSKRGYTKEGVLEDLDKREPDSAAYIRPQETQADIVITFNPNGDDEEAADVKLAEGLPHPDLSLILDSDIGITMEDTARHEVLHIPGNLERDKAEECEQAIWDRMHFASHLDTEMLGEYSIGDDKKRSEPLALIQLLLMYHLVTAKAAVALGAQGSRTDGD